MPENLNKYTCADQVSATLEAIIYCAVRVSAQISKPPDTGHSIDFNRRKRELGAHIPLFNSSELATGELNQFNTIIIGTRAYAVRQDLHTYNYRLSKLFSLGKN